MKNRFAPSLFAAVEVSGKAANFAQAEFISAEHFNHRGPHSAFAEWGIGRTVGSGVVIDIAE